MAKMTLEDLQRQQGISQGLRRVYEQRWARAKKLSKGIFREGASKSRIRNVQKIFFRKIWTTIWRLVASMYQTFLKDPDNFRIEGRDTENDPHRAKVLQKNVEWRRDQLYRQDNMFLKFIWAFWDIFENGVAFGKFTWLYEEDKYGNVITDRPRYVAYPPEQVFPDLTAATEDEMQYCHFLNYMTKGQAEDFGIKNTDDFEATSVDSSEARRARYAEGPDPLQDPSEGNHYQTATQNAQGEYPKSGRYEDGAVSDGQTAPLYKIYESFWMQDGVMQYGVHSNFQHWAKDDEGEMSGDSPYGKKIPLVMGLCLIEPHKLIGEGFGGPLEGPQESFNYNLNMRKDGIAAALSGMTIIENGSNTNIEALLQRRKLGLLFTDNVNGVKHEQIPDVTQSAYLESEADSAMMDEMSGVTPGKRGMEKTDKATVAQINYAESNAKIDLYSALVGETFMKKYFSLLTWLVQLFETDETVMRVANDSFRAEQEDYAGNDVYDYGFEVDCIVNAGIASGRETEIKQTLLAFDRGLQYMQTIPALIQFNAIPPEGLKVPNLQAFYEDLLPVVGKKNLKRYLINLKQPQQPEGGAAGVASQPAPGESQNLTNMAQEGAFGGL